MSAMGATDGGGRMRVGFKIRRLDDAKLRYVKQLGVDDVVYLCKSGQGYEPVLPRELPWSVEELTELRERIEDHDLRLAAVSNVPYPSLDDVMLGRPGRDEQLARLRETIRNLGAAGVDTLGYYWWPGGVTNELVRTAWDVPDRGGATVTAFDRDELPAMDRLLDREYAEAELWEYYEQFLRGVLPTAEEAGVRLALHPNDPPIEGAGGVPFLFRSTESFERAMELVPSESHGLLACLGCFSELGAAEEVIERFGPRGKLFYVHFRDVRGTVPSFRETFVGEGNFDAWAVLRQLRDVGYDGLLLPDHTPMLEGDEDWDGFIGGYRGRAHAAGYLQGMLAALYAEG